MNLFKIIKNEYFYSIFSKVLSLIIGIIYSVVFARFFGASIKGESAYIMGLISVGSIIMTLGLHQAYPYYKKRGIANLKDSFMTLMWILFVIFVLCVFILSFLIQDLSFRLALFFIPIAAFSRIFNYVNTIESPNSGNLVVLISYIIQIILSLFIVFFLKKNIMYAMISLMTVEFFKLLLSNWNVKFKFKPTLIKRLFVVELMKYGFFPMIALLLTILNYRIDIFMLENNPVITLSQIGVYAVGINFAERSLIIPDSIKTVVTSKLSKGGKIDEFISVMRITFFVSLIITIIIIVVAEPLIQILYGNEFLGAHKVLIISVSGIVMMTYYKLIAQYNIVNRKQIINTVVLSFGLIINILLNLILISKYGIYGAAYATLISYWTTSIILMIIFSIQNRKNLFDLIFIKKTDLKQIKYTLLNIKKEDDKL